MATVKLYDKNAYETVFAARVISCEKKLRYLISTSEDKAETSAKDMKENIEYDVILDQTLFFPEEGGQSPDKGILEGANVLDVQIKDDVIIHTVDRPLAVGEMVRGEIDWNHRFSNMQQHSGEHIFSGTVYRKYGYLNVGFHLSDQIATMDFNGPLTMEQIEELEWEVNRVIALNVPIKAGYPSKEDLAQMEYRSKKEIDGAIRIVEVEGYDVCACCAPHVARTGEIGGFKVQSVQNYKGGVRIRFLCGFRALMEARKKAQVISDLSGILTTNQEMLAENVQKLKARNQELQYELNQAKQALMELKMEGIPREQKDVILFEQNLDAAVMRNVVNKLVEEHEGICGVFVRGIEVGDDKVAGEDKTAGKCIKDNRCEYKFIIGSKNVDCRKIATLMREKLSARGGGSPVMIQGSVVAAADEIQNTVLYIKV